MPYTFSACPIPGLFEILPKVFGDARGYFFETYTDNVYLEAGITGHFVQDNQSKSSKGVLRGLHYQIKYPQGKLVRVISGEVLDVAVDIRPGSPTYGKSHAVVLNDKTQNQFYIPPGFAHGFLVLSEEAIFVYKCTDYYHPEDEGGILWNDPFLGIKWPDMGMDFIISDKDKKLPPFGEHKR